MSESGKPARQFALVVSAAAHAGAQDGGGTRQRADCIRPDNADRVAQVLRQRFGLDHVTVASGVHTGEAFLAVLRGLLEQGALHPGDRLLIYVYGHGQARGEHETVFRMLFPGGGVTHGLLLETLNDERLTDITLVVDACQSGCLECLFPEKRRNAYTLLTSCGADEGSEQPPEGLSVFTGAFVRALDELAPAPGGTLAVGRLYERTVALMRETRCGHAPRLFPPEAADRCFLRVEPGAVWGEAPQGSLRLFGEELLRQILAADTRHGQHCGRPDAKRTWLIYLNSVGNVSRKPAAEWLRNERDLLEAILEAEAGPKPGIAVADPSSGSRASWGPFCAFVYSYAQEWLRLSERFPDAQKRAAQTAAQGLKQQLESLVASRNQPGLDLKELDRWREMAARMAEQPLGVHITLDTTTRAAVDEVQASVLLRLACRAEPLRAVELTRSRLIEPGAAPDLSATITSLLREVQVLLPGWKRTDLDLHFFLDSSQAHWPVEAISVSPRERLGQAFRCRIRLRERHRASAGGLGADAGGAAGSRERPAAAMADGLWREHTDELRGGPTEDADLGFVLETTAAGCPQETLCRDLVQRGAFLAPHLFGSAASERLGTERELFELLRDCGTVAAVWTRPGLPVSEALVERIASTLRGQGIARWPELVRRLRGNQERGEPSLALVCDPSDDPELPAAWQAAELERTRSAFYL